MAGKSGIATTGLFRTVVALGALSFMSGAVLAQSLYKWVDENGNVTYQDTPPPSNVEFEEQEYTDPNAEPAPSADVGQELNDAIERNPVTFYSIPDCDACDLVRLYLENHAVPFAEKDIRDNLTSQQELQNLTGQLTVPTVVVGDDVVDGYSRSAIRQILESNGYPIDQLASTDTQVASGEQPESATDGELSDNALENLSNVFEGEDFQEESLESEEIEPEDAIIEIQAE